MKRRNMTNIDLRLLTIVNELNKTRSVSQAAENLELSQSAVSMSLARLRKHFKDPLFVRTPDGMEPTPQMSELIELLEKAEGLLETALVHRIAFHPVHVGPLVPPGRYRYHPSHYTAGAHEALARDSSGRRH